MKLLEIRDVWVRRGNIADKATDKERALMREETERIRDSKIVTQQEPVSEKHKDVTVFMAVYALFLMIFLPFRFGLYWVLGNGMFNLVNTETIYFVLTFTAVVVVGWVFFRDNFLNLLLRTVRRTTVPYVFGYILFVLILSVVNLEVFLYPESTGMFFASSFIGFFQIGIVDLLIFAVSVGLLHFPMTEYYATLENEQYKPNPKTESIDLARKFSNCFRFIRKKRPAIGFVTILAVMFIMIPLDLNLSLFTPSLVNNGETFSHILPFESSENIYLFIYSNCNMESKSTKLRI